MELWFEELHSRGTGLHLKVRRTLLTEKTEFQEIQVLETEDWGRALLLDGKIMFTQRDEFIYHEMMTHPALFTHPAPRRCLVIGGGDGGSLREILRHREVEEAAVCEIDPRVPEVALEFFPEISRGFSDPRARLIIREGFGFLKESPAEFDVILVDSTDPVGPAEALFSREFILAARQALAPQGLLVLQSESPFHHLELVKRTYGYFKEAFPSAWIYTAPVPTYPGGWWSWTMGSLGPDPLAMSAPERVERLSPRLRYWTPDLHRAAFALPAFLEQAFAAE